MQSVCSA